MFKTDFVEKRGRAWVVLSKDGRVLGRHTSKEAALRQLRAVELSKKRRG